MLKLYKNMVVPPRFELGSSVPKTEMIDRYTMGLLVGIPRFELKSPASKAGRITMLPYIPNGTQCRI